MRNNLFLGVAFSALMLPGAAFAQSTGSVDFDQGDIVITAARASGVAGIQVSDTSKAKGVLSQEFISRQTPGNSILDTINALPGVSFQNNDPFGSAGGTLTIRGFDASRISLTFDGVPLNDTGNYALYSNQQLDPELIEQVNVNYGSTDVDSPSAAASGSTVNYRTVNPSDKFGARLQGSVGDYNFFRIFGKIDTGEFGPWGTKAWISASHAENNVVFNDFGKIRKAQYNAKIYQPIGSNGDFISVSGNYNVNRNNFFGSAPLRLDPNTLSQITAPTVDHPNTATNIITPQNPFLIVGALRTPGTGTANRFPASRDELPYHVARCTTPIPVPGVADAAGTCGTTFDERYNPSNTGNIRINSRFTLAPGLVLTVDPSFQYVKANGGGTVAAREGKFDINPAGATAGSAGVANCTTVTSGTGVDCETGYYAGFPYVGKDLNGDGDTLDQVNVLAASQTGTHRYGVIAGLRYDISEGQTLRIGYSFDRGRHRQTGELAYLQFNGFPTDVFPINNPILSSSGTVLQKRDRLSYATLNQVSGQYRGQFFDNKLTIDFGVRAPFYQRDLTQNCFTSSAGGFVECTGSAALNTAEAGYHPYVLVNGVPVSAAAQVGATPAVFAAWSPPQSRTYKYNRVLPSGGFTYKVDQHFTVFASYSKGLQVPGTDNLYNAMFFPVGSAQATPAPETTDNFDGGVRYTSSTIQAEVGPWYTKFTNRLASAFDPDTQQTVYRNLGRVDKYGIDGSIAYRPIHEVTIYVYGSYLKSKIKNDIVLGNCPAVLTTANTTSNCTTAGAPIYAFTAGKRESGAPVYTFGGRLQGQIGPVELAVQAKRTGPRYLNDQNLPQIQCTATLLNAICPTAANTPASALGNFTGTRGFQYQVYDAKTPAYTVVDFDMRVSMEWAGLNKQTFLQLNLQNAFNQYYIGGFSGGSTVNTSVPFVQIGSPRAFIATLNAQF
jgi:iron complex outermembrane receptor protein